MKAQRTAYRLSEFAYKYANAVSLETFEWNEKSCKDIGGIDKRAAYRLSEFAYLYANAALIYFSYQSLCYGQAVNVKVVKIP